MNNNLINEEDKNLSSDGKLRASLYTHAVDLNLKKIEELQVLFDNETDIHEKAKLSYLIARRQKLHYDNFNMSE